MKTTQFAKKEEVSPVWYVLDADDNSVGRVATLAAYILRGKHRPDFTPHIDMGDHIIIVNAEKVNFTGKKWDQKRYYRHSGYPGSLKEVTARKMMEKHPDRILLHAVKGMLPKNRLGRKLLTKIRVYPGSDHPHEAQQPTQIEISEDKFIQVKK